MYAAQMSYAQRRGPKPTGSPALAGMVFAMAFLAREPFMICLRRLLSLARRSGAAEQPRQSLTAIRASVLGQHQAFIIDLHGQPRTTMNGKCPIWYYAVDAGRRLAMAITFHDERAVLVEFFQLP
jgi:hypothetical protein